MKLKLPIPPSVNALYANRKIGGRFRTREYKAWLLEAQYFLPNVKPVYGPYRVHIQVPRTMRGDVDNRVKPILDFLVKQGLTDDDSKCQGTSIERADVDCAIVEVTEEK